MGILRYLRRRISKRYAHRFIQDIDYIEIDHLVYKYKMIQDRSIQTKVIGYKIVTDYFVLYKDGRLLVFAGYAWDGPSGPTLDTPSFMRSSCAHDVFFQILRECLIPDFDRVLVFYTANKELKRISKIDGMLWPFYHIAKIAVDLCGKKYTRK